MVPLHNACSYGHYEVTELLVKHGASVNAVDLWQFTPLHEAGSKNRHVTWALKSIYYLDYMLGWKSALFYSVLALIQRTLIVMDEVLLM